MVTNLPFLEARERFLPIKGEALRARMLRDPRLSADERQCLGKLFDLIAARFHFDFREKLEQLRTAYDPFDPDCDLLPSPQPSASQEGQRETFARAIISLLQDANYVEMPREQVLACAEFQSQSGVVVQADLSDYSQLRLFYRGIRHEVLTVRLWQRPWRRRSQMSHVFSRVALLVQLAKTPQGPMFLKLFKNVVAEDLEMLLPHVRIRMRLIDHLKIGSSVAGGVATAALKVFTAAILSPWVLLLVISGCLGSALRAVFSFLSCKTKYMQTISSNLYFQNLANNTSAIVNLIDCAEAEECKELLLAYYILYVERSHALTQLELHRRVEQWLQTEFGVDADFDIRDAVRKLHDKGLLTRRPLPNQSSSGTEEILNVYDLPSSLRRLDAALDAYYAYNHHALAPDQDRLADEQWPPTGS
ncbi:MAG: DUF3754 domain-containing protein [Pirellulaceae bacterium]